MKRKIVLIIAAVLSNSATFAASDESGWFVRPYIGMSSVDDTTGNAINVDGVSGNTDIQLDTGFVSGIGIGYHYNDRVSSEIAWEYRSNDSQVNVANQSNFNDGNYASNSFFINGHYRLGKRQRWQPYIGAGLGWLQEIDLDLERSGTEISLTGDGEVGYQVFAGVNYELNEKLKMQTEVRYADFGDVDLVNEQNSSQQIQQLEYSPVTLQVGLQYNF